MTIDANIPQDLASTTFKYSPRSDTKTDVHVETPGPSKSIEVFNYSNNTVYVVFSAISQPSNQWDMAIPAWTGRTQAYTGEGSLTTFVVGTGQAVGVYDNVRVTLSPDPPSPGVFPLAQPVTLAAGASVGINGTPNVNANQAGNWVFAISPANASYQGTGQATAPATVTLLANSQPKPTNRFHTIICSASMAGWQTTASSVVSGDMTCEFDLFSTNHSLAVAVLPYVYLAQNGTGGQVTVPPSFVSIPINDLDTSWMGADTTWGVRAVASMPTGAFVGIMEIAVNVLVF